jgi:hypothetical protein
LRIRKARSPFFADRRSIKNCRNMSRLLRLTAQWRGFLPRGFEESLSVPDALPVRPGGPRLELTQPRGARAIASPREAARCNERRTRLRKRYPPRASRSHGVRFGRNALRQNGRTATEARVRSPLGGA